MSSSLLPMISEAPGLSLASKSSQSFVESVLIASLASEQSASALRTVEVTSGR